MKTTTTAPAASAASSVRLSKRAPRYAERLYGETYYGGDEDQSSDARQVLASVASVSVAASASASVRGV